MAKNGFKIAPADTQKVQEIIGRALTDKKFLTSLKKDPRKTLAKYALAPASVALIEKGLKLKVQVEKLEEQLADHFGGEVQAG
jgi:hypothetical protein